MRRAFCAFGSNQRIAMGRVLSSSWQLSWSHCNLSTRRAQSPCPMIHPPSPVRRFTVAAAAAEPPSLASSQAAAYASSSAKPPPDSHPSKPRQQHHDYHDIAANWQVRRTSLHHYFPAAQQHMKGEWRGSRAAKPLTSSSQPQQLPAPSGLMEPSEAAKQLLAAIDWEASGHHRNGIGRTGERFSAWAAGRLCQLAGQLSTLLDNDSPADSSAASLVATCHQLASELVSYDKLDAAGKTQLTQRSRLAAEELHHEAVMRYKQQNRMARYSGTEIQQAQQAVLAQEQRQSQVEQEAAHPSSSPSKPSAPHAVPAVMQALSASLTTSSPARPPAAPPSPFPWTGGPSGESQALAADPDAAAALAHEEETANGRTALASAPGGLPAGRTETRAMEGGLVSEESGGEEGTGKKAKKRVVAPARQAFHRSFAEAAAAFEEALGEPGVATLAGGAQRTAEWHRLREKRLTASVFSKALGFFSGDREGLWEEKVGLRAPFAGNEATAWGNRSEPLALEDYQLNTGQVIEGCMFQVKHDDMVHGWLGASPDGLIGGLHVSLCDTGHTPPRPMRGAGLLSGDGPGIVEVKCPFNKGNPEGAVPPHHAIWYYMPQVQGLMDIFDRGWCNLFIWTVAGGSGLYHIPRDRRYWAECFSVLADFWWGHVVPARQARERYSEEVLLPTLDQYRPHPQAPTTSHLKEWSKEMAIAAPATFFPPRTRG